MVLEFEDIFVVKIRFQFDFNGDIKLSEFKVIFFVYNYRQCFDDGLQFCFIEVCSKRIKINFEVFFVLKKVIIKILMFL